MIDWVSLQLDGNLCYWVVFALFNLYLRAISKYKPPWGLYSKGRFNGGFFRARSLRGLYLEGLIFGILRGTSSHVCATVRSQSNLPPSKDCTMRGSIFVDHQILGNIKNMILVSVGSIFANSLDPIESAAMSL